MLKEFSLVLAALLIFSCKQITDEKTAPVSIPLSHSPNVYLVNEKFPVHQLDTTTEVWIYLPHNYFRSKKKYPVFYVIGGDHFFTDGPEVKDWKVDETMDSIIGAGVTPSIIVAAKSFKKDSVYEIKTADFFANSLKPFIDSAYRTKPDESIIVGAGNYASASLVSALKYHEIFKGAGVFSPPAKIYDVLKQNNISGKGYKGMIFFYSGSQDKEMVDLADRLGANSSAYIYLIDKQNVRRHQSPLGGWFPEFYKWALSNGHSYIIRPRR